MYKVLISLVLLAGTVPVIAQDAFEMQAFELAQKLDLEPAGASGKSMGANDVYDLLRNGDPVVRKAAAKAAVQYISSSRIQRTLVEMLGDYNEADDTRKEAAKTLSYASPDYKIRNALFGAAEDIHNPVEVKSVSYKALWQEASRSSAVQDRLIYAAMDTTETDEVRGGAAWALFNSTSRSKVLKALNGVAADASLPVTLRIESIKSLYQSAYGHSATKKVLETLVAAASENMKIRKTAALCLSSARSDFAISRFLEDIANGTCEPELREAAMQALYPEHDHMRKLFHLPHRLPGGEMSNPIDNQ